MIPLRIFIISLMLSSASFLAFAYENNELSQPIDQLEQLAKHPNLLSLARKHDGQLDLDQIRENHQIWLKQPNQRNAQLDSKMQSYFKQLLNEKNSPFTELVLMGTQGETLAAYPINHNYWQGNEDMFINVMASENLYIDTLNWDETSQTISAQISVPVMDEDGELFGVLTGAVKASLEALGNLNIGP